MSQSLLLLGGAIKAQREKLGLSQEIVELMAAFLVGSRSSNNSLGHRRDLAAVNFTPAIHNCTSQRTSYLAECRLATSPRRLSRRTNRHRTERSQLAHPVALERQLA